MTIVYENASAKCQDVAVALALITEECTVWYRTECTNCHSIEHGVVYDGCPVAVEFDRQTNQRSNLLKQQYRQQLNEQQTREKEIIKTQRKP